MAALAGAGWLAALMFGGRPADAKASYESPYGFERTWNASMRLIRVDMGLKIEEKDDQAGYLLFEYKSAESGSKSSQGSMELVRPREPGQPVHVMVQLPRMPHYHEQVVMDSLVRKLRDEYGEPPKARPKPTSPDGGSDAEPREP